MKYFTQKKFCENADSGLKYGDSLVSGLRCQVLVAESYKGGFCAKLAEVSSASSRVSLQRLQRQM